MTTPHNGLPAIHPGEFLRETLDELGLTQAALPTPWTSRPCASRTCSRATAP